MNDDKNRERFSSRLGFILISAGCAIGLGNVWRFPYVVGEYGGGAFVFLYLIFLVLLGLPILVMELAVGRASKQSIATSFERLAPRHSKWPLFSYVGMAGNYLLMMFYTTIGGWILCYCARALTGSFSDKTPQEVAQVFTDVTSSPLTNTFWMVIAVILGFFVCSLGLKNGVERITKWMMIFLLAILVVLVVYVLSLPGSLDGLAFYLIPSVQRMEEAGISDCIFAAMGQAFFTLSIGIGSMSIFGSYIDKNHTLTGEALRITVLDTSVALISGLIVFPACFAFGVQPDSGPNLVFVTLPNIFNEMAGGRIFGALFFVFLSFAALSTIIAVFENIVSFGIDKWNWSRKKSVVVNLILLLILSLPTAWGFNLLSNVQPLGAGSTILDLEDFIVSNNLLPLGALVYVLFCTHRYGWGFDAFLKEANTGSGVKLTPKIRFYLAYILPIIIVFIFIQGYLSKFF